MLCFETVDRRGKAPETGPGGVPGYRREGQGRAAALLGEHTDEILTAVLGFKAKDVAEIKGSGALSAPEKKEKAA